MQRTVSSLKNNFGKFVIIFFATVIAIVLIVFCFSIFPFKSGLKTTFDEKKFYFVFTNKSVNQSELINSQELIKKLGGSGEIIQIKDYYYLISSVYTLEDDAKNVEQKIKTNFGGCGTLTLTAKKINNLIKNIAYNNQDILDFFSFQSKLSNEIIERGISYLSGQTTVRDFSAYVLEKKIELEKIKIQIETINKSIESNKTDSQNERKNALISSVIFSSNLYNLYFDNFLNNFFDSSKKDSLVSELATNFILCYCDFCNNL